MREGNILLAIEHVRQNKGSNTAGTDGLTFKDLPTIPEIIRNIQAKIKNYHPKPALRVNIPKSNGTTRPLGIPCIHDRIVQQCIRQIIEPICEKKFYKYSYGFRPRRSAIHALAKVSIRINCGNFYHAVNIDIKGFFDNVNHKKLIKQLWNIGIKCKSTLALISKILTSGVVVNGIMESTQKGTPQGGIISPLLANVVLNELDWFIDRQWLGFKTKREYKNESIKIAHLRKSNLTEQYITRYADDFIILCRYQSHAEKVMTVTTKFLKDKLYLDISPEKSKVVDLRKSKLNYLGFSLFAAPKGDKYICRTEVSNKAKKRIYAELKDLLIAIRRNGYIEDACRYNRKIIGYQNYFRYATSVTLNFAAIGRKISGRLSCIKSLGNYKTQLFYARYNNFNGRIYSLKGVTLYPIQATKFKVPMQFSDKVTKEPTFHSELRKLEESTITEWDLIRSMVYKRDRGICQLSNIFVPIDKLDIHHKIPRAIGGSDEIQNLITTDRKAHQTYHAQNPQPKLIRT